MKFLVALHDFSAPAGLLGERILAHGDSFDLFYPAENFGSPQPDRPMALPAGHQDYQGLVILGGPMDADDEAGHPYFRDIFRLIGGFEQAAKPVLGLCLGAQLLARFHGAKIHRMTRKELGFTACRLLPDAATDPLLRGFPAEIRWMEWHQDRFDLPPRAVPLIAGDFCPYQAFRVGEKTYAFQAHPEASIDIIRHWIFDGSRGKSASIHAELPRIEAEAAEHLRQGTVLASLLFDRWIALAENG